MTNPMIECGNLPAFMPEFAATTFYNSNKVSRVKISNYFELQVQNIQSV